MSNSQGSHRGVPGGLGWGGAARPDGRPYPAPYTPTVPAYAAAYADTVDAGPALRTPSAGTPPGGARQAGRRKAPDRPDGLRRLLPQALVVALLAGGTSAFVASDKAVRLSVDGTPRTLHTFAGTVDELLAEEHVPVGAHDLVTPGHRGALADGDAVTVRYARPLVLTLDGQHHKVWTTARTVEAALRRLGVRAEGAYLSTSRFTPISRHGLALDVRTERTVTFMADGREHTVRTNAATVAEALDEAGIGLQGQDTTSVPAGSFPRDGQTVTVLRIAGSTEVREEPIAFRTRKTLDPTLFAGTESVTWPGAAGLRRVTYELRTVNGVGQKPRKVSDEVVRQPETRIVRIGTRPHPGTSAAADGLDWGGLAHCESGGHAAAVDETGGYGGLYQLDGQTWHALGGSGLPQYAPAGEQTYRAKRLYMQRGASPWPLCGRRLYG
ncbi:ubiquitin-like domain-containing protein [Streptomyces sp. NBC_00344]|uniref:ubiquitin-like domain-containing protein n=1 Tax=Streptomyces sp. NBC_00344 TaxID=2975720 RepID=UPI002E1FD9CC